MSEVLQNLSDALAQAVTTAGAGVVRVEGRRRLPASGVVWSAEGLVLTANHVVHHDDQVRIAPDGGQALEAELVGRDPTTDLALLRVASNGLKAIDRAAADSMQVGHLVLALGRPGRTVQATLGIISALGEGWRTRHGGSIDRYLQTDVVMYPGFSGGPLIDAQGRLLGLNSSGLAQGLSLALPLPTLERVAGSLAAHGHVRRGYLGVSTQQVRLPESTREELGQKTGLLLVAVESGSPAEQGGLAMGDTIVALADSAVANHEDLIGLLSGDRVGAPVLLRILRGGQLQKVEVTVGER